MKSQLIHIPQRLTIRHDGFINREKVLPYDMDNCYPQRVLNIIFSSSMGTAVTNMFSKFIEGKGFKNENFAQAKINEREVSIENLLREHSKNYARLGGIAMQVNYNANYEIVEVNYVPFEYCRLSHPLNNEHPNMIAVYDDWAMQKKYRIQIEKIQWFDKFNTDPNIISQQVIAAGGWDKWHGQILWHSNHIQEYPIAPCDSVLEDLISDYNTKIYKTRNITTGFMASYILETLSEENSADDENLNELNKNEMAMQNNLEKFQGAENGGKLLWIQKKTEDQLFKLSKVELQENVDKVFAFTEKSTMDSILRCFGQMPQLLGIVAVNRLGIATELKDSTDAYNHRTSHERRMFSSLYKKVFSKFKGGINPQNDWDIIPIEPIEITDDSNIGNIIKLMTDTPGGANIPDERKRAILMKVFDYSEHDADALLAKPIVPPKLPSAP